jgi:TonB family protein
MDGSVIRTKVVKSLGPNGCDEAAVDAIKSVAWKPAKQRDRPVKVWIAVPVDFKLR